MQFPPPVLDRRPLPPPVHTPRPTSIGRCKVTGCLCCLTRAPPPVQSFRRRCPPSVLDRRPRLLLAHTPRPTSIGRCKVTGGLCCLTRPPPPVQSFRMRCPPPDLDRRPLPPPTHTRRPTSIGRCKESESVSTSKRQNEEQMPRETGTRQERTSSTGDPHRGGRTPQRTHHRRGGPHMGPTQNTHRHKVTRCLFK